MKKFLTGLVFAIGMLVIVATPLVAQGRREWSEEPSVTSVTYIGTVSLVRQNADGIWELLVEEENGNATLFRESSDGFSSNIAWEDIENGDKVEIEFNGITTRSLPPQATANKLTLLEKGMAEEIPEIEEFDAPDTPAVASSTYLGPIAVDTNIFVYRGTVMAMSEMDQNGNQRFLVQQETPGINYGQPSVYFVVGPDTTGSFSAIKVGDYVEITYGPIMALSLPPQTMAFSLHILPSYSEVAINGTYLGRVFNDEEAKSGSILVYDSVRDDEIIFFFDETTLIHGVDLLTLSTGSNIAVYFSTPLAGKDPMVGTAETMSLV